MSQGKRKGEVDFLLADKNQMFLQIDYIILRVCPQTYPNTQNNKFAISLQCLKKEVSDEVDFLHADKNENFIQIDVMIFDAGMLFDGDGQAFPKFPKQQVCNGFIISQK